MSETWHNWCRMCGKTDSSDTDIIFKVNSLKDKLQIVNECFMISLFPFNGTLSSLCGECCNFVGKLKGFKYRCLKADQMFKELMLREVPEIDLQAIRWKFGVDKHTILTHDNDGPESQNKEISKDEEAFSDSSLDSQDIQSDEMTVEEPIPTVSIPGYKIKELPPNKKLFIVSHNKEKSYIPITYHGEFPKYDDFIKCTCQELKLNNITIYDQDEREITPNTFPSVLTTNYPPFVVVKTGMPSGTSFPEPSNEKNTEDFYKQVVPMAYSAHHQDSEQIVQTWTGPECPEDKYCIENENLIESQIELEHNRLICKEEPMEGSDSEFKGVPDIKAYLAESLCKVLAPVRKPEDPNVEHQRKKKSVAPIPPIGVRMDSIDHLPIYVSKKSRSRCRNHNCKMFTNIKCHKCQVYLCMNQNRNCFLNFHS